MVSLWEIALLFAMIVLGSLAILGALRWSDRRWERKHNDAWWDKDPEGK